MTSQLNVDTIVDKAGSGGTNVKIGNTSTFVSDGGAVTQNTVQGITKNWCRLDQYDGTDIRDSFNTSSYTDIGTGEQLLSYANNMSNALYSLVGTPHYGGSANDMGTVGWQSDGNLLTSSYRIYTFFAINSGSAFSLYDVEECMTQVNGDLA